MPSRSPEKPAASTPMTTCVLPMELKHGDRIVDETGEYEAGMKGDLSEPELYPQGLESSRPGDPRT